MSQNGQDSLRSADEPSGVDATPNPRVKQAWTRPQVVVLDARETASGGEGLVEEVSVNKPGS